MAFRQLSQALLTICHEAFYHPETSSVDTKLNALKKYVEDYLRKKLLVKRNEIVHGVWSHDEESDDFGIQKTIARSALREEHLPYTSEQIEAVADEVEAAFIRLNELLLDLEPVYPISGQRPPTWLEKRNWQGSRRPAN